MKKTLFVSLAMLAACGGNPSMQTKPDGGDSNMMTPDGGDSNKMKPGGGGGTETAATSSQADFQKFVDAEKTKPDTAAELTLVVVEEPRAITTFINDECRAFTYGQIQGCTDAPCGVRIEWHSALDCGTTVPARSPLADIKVGEIVKFKGVAVRDGGVDKLNVLKIDGISTNKKTVSELPALKVTDATLLKEKRFHNTRVSLEPSEPMTVDSGNISTHLVSKGQRIEIYIAEPKFKEYTAARGVVHYDDEEPSLRASSESDLTAK